VPVLQGKGSGGEVVSLDVEGTAELGLELDEPCRRRERGQGAGEPQAVGQGRVAPALVVLEQGGAYSPGRPQRTVRGHGQQLGVPERVGDPVARDRVAVVAGVTDERPAAADAAADERREADRTAERARHGPGGDPVAQPGDERGEGIPPGVQPARSRTQQGAGEVSWPDQPDAGLPRVGGEDPGEGAVTEVELVAVPRHVAHIGVEARAGGRVSLEDRCVHEQGGA
jgi:hypothetical protein